MCFASKIFRCLIVLTVFMSAASDRSAFAQLASNGIPITIQADGSVRLQFQGSPGSPFQIQSADSLALPFWQILADQTADSNGFVFFTDTNAAPISRFYRPATPTTAPVATNIEVAGDENNLIPAILSGTDPLNPSGSLTAIITSLPAQGTLYQYNSNAITSVPALIIDSQHRALFQGASYDSGSNYAAFTYVLRRDSDGVASAPARVQVDVNFVPVAPVNTTPNPAVLENTSIVFQLTCINLNLKHGPDPVRAIVTSPTIKGALYQVLPDNVTPGEQITGQVFVSNTNNLLCYKPPDFAFGNNFDSFGYLLVNSYNIQSPNVNLPINVIHVDQPIYASPTTVTADPSALSTSIFVTTTSADDYPITLVFTNMPQKGSLYVGSVSPENLVTPTHNGFNPSSQFLFVRQNVGECGVTNDTGFPYAVLGFVITNTVGKSASATITINVPPAPAPPFFTSPMNYTLQENSNLTFAVTGASPQSTVAGVIIGSGPQHGTLYQMRGSLFQPLTAYPFYYPTNQPLMYVPNTNYFGPDSFQADLYDSAGNETCSGTNFGGNLISFNVQEVNLPPSVHNGTGSGFGAVLVYDDSNNLVSVFPAVLEAIASDSDALPTDLERITIRALKSGLPADGQLSLLTTNGLVGLQFTSPVECTFEGTLANINNVLNFNFQYSPAGGTSDADSVVVILNDEGHNGAINNPLQSSVTLSITYAYQFGGSL